MGKIKNFIIRKLGGYTTYDLEKSIMNDRKGREMPRTIQFEITLDGEPSDEQNKKAKALIHKIAFEHLIRESRIHTIYNPIGLFTNYFLIYDIPIKNIMEEINYNVKEN